MKTNRLLGMITILLNHEKVTVQFLAEKFEVSRRTILRDIETLSETGFPLITEQGYKGGVSMMPGFKLDKTFLQQNEITEILLGLQALESINKSESYDKIAARFGQDAIDIHHFQINLTGYRKEKIIKDMQCIEASIMNRNYVTFQYFNSRGTTQRNVKPYCVIFQWSDWYLWGYCEEKEEERLFKISRIVDLRRMERTFDHAIPKYQKKITEYYAKNTYAAVIKFDNEIKWRVIDEFGREHIEEYDSYFIFRFPFENDQFLIQWVLSFGAQAEVIEPKEIRDKVIEIYQNVAKRYE